MARIIVASKTSTSVTVYLGELDTNYSKGDRRIDWYVENTYKVYTTIPAYASESDTATLSGLSSSTTYTIYAKVYVGTAFDPFITFDISVTTNPATSTRPSKFSWTYTKTKDQPFNLTAIEWNNLTTNINDVREYKSLSKYSFTTATTNSPFTAVMYNEARSAIQGIGVGSSISEVKKGEKITADCLNILVTSINGVT